MIQIKTLIYEKYLKVVAGEVFPSPQSILMNVLMIQSNIGINAHLLASQNTMFIDSTLLLVSKLYLSRGKKTLAHLSFSVCSSTYFQAEGYLLLNNS